MPIVKNVKETGRYVDDLGGVVCLMSAVEVEEDGHRSVYYATVAEDWENEFCVSRVPFGKMCGESSAESVWNIVPDDVTEAIKNAGIFDSLLNECGEGYAAEGSPVESEYPNIYPMTPSEKYGYGEIEYGGKKHTGVFSYIDRDVEYLFKDMPYPYTGVEYIGQRATKQA